jgi:hypothetical protein
MICYLLKIKLFILFLFTLTQKEKSQLGTRPIKPVPSKSPNQAGICRRLPRLRLDSCDDVNVGKFSEAVPSSTSSQSSTNSKVTTNSKIYEERWSDSEYKMDFWARWKQNKEGEVNGKSRRIKVTKYDNL